jgi:hypothetical protein
MPYFWQSGEIAHLEQLKLFEALARADERKIVMNEPLTKEMWQRFEDEIRADEREACADAVRLADNGTEAVELIRARGDAK